MPKSFSDLMESPDNQIFRVVFYPDRVYHAEYLNATRSPRYRYNVREVRNQFDIQAIVGEVYLDNAFLCNFLRLEYRGARLVEAMRENNRLLESSVEAWVRLVPKGAGSWPEGRVKLHYCRWIDAFQVELWETLESPPTVNHDCQVLDMMGGDGEITRKETFASILRDTSNLQYVEAAFVENSRSFPSRRVVPEDKRCWDNNYGGNYQKPNVTDPSSDQNSEKFRNYCLNFQRGWYLDANKTEPVRYRSAMMDDDNPAWHNDNVIEMRWMLQRELGASMVFFHEVTIPKGKIEGTHRHIGTEELYYITEGEGEVLLGEGDSPEVDLAFPTEEAFVYGFGKRKCKVVPVNPGKVIFTKSNGIHGIRNTGDGPLKFVAFLYHCR